MITFDEFLKVVKEELQIDTDFAPKYIDSMENTIGIRWCTGGTTGGSCYDDSNHPPRFRSLDGEPQPEFHDLDKILEKFKPDLSFMGYKKICRETIVEDNYTENEYYGNHSNYSYKYVDLKKLYEIIGIGE